MRRGRSAVNRTLARTLPLGGRMGGEAQSVCDRDPLSAEVLRRPLTVVTVV